MGNMDTGMTHKPHIYCKRKNLLQFSFSDFMMRINFSHRVMREMSSKNIILLIVYLRMYKEVALKVLT